MSLENLSTTNKQTIVILAILFIFFVKIKGFISKPTIFLTIALAVIGIVTEAKPLNATEFPNGLNP